MDLPRRPGPRRLACSRRRWPGAGVDDASRRGVAATPAAARGCARGSWPRWRARPGARAAGGTARISDLVGRRQGLHVHRPRGAQEIDVHEGLESTLTMLGHKLKQSDVRSSATTTPSCRRSRRGLRAQPGLDQPRRQRDRRGGRRGTISIRTCRRGTGDRGGRRRRPGMPARLQTRLFEPSSPPRRSARAPAWASTSSGASSRTTAEGSQSRRDRARPASQSGSRSRIADDHDQHGRAHERDLHTPRRDPRRHRAFEHGGLLRMPAQPGAAGYTCACA